LVFHGRSLSRVGARAGHFFQWRLLGAAGWTRAHPYSLSAPPCESEARITIKPVGDGSARDIRTPIGALALIEGPYGALPPASRREARAPALYIAGGLGLAPLAALIEEASQPAKPPFVIVRCADERRAALLDRVSQMVAERGGEIRVLAGHRRGNGSWLPAAGPPDGEALAQLVPDIAERMVYVCGPGEWVAAVRRAALSAGAKRERLVTEGFI
jgi:ferredoxin-NADP reductase